MRFICHCTDANGIIDFALNGMICSHCASGVRRHSDATDDVLILRDCHYWLMINGMLSGWHDNAADGVRMVAVELFY